MTSLFRRNSSNGNSKSGSPAAPSQLLNNNRPPRQVRRLEFNQAMEDFKVMFPNMDYDVIECVLRANNGAVDATIDQLLQMSLDCGFDNGYDESSDSEDSIPPEILERTLEPDSSDEEAPPVYSPPAYDMHVFDRQYPHIPPLPPRRLDIQSSSGSQSQRRYRNWNPPLLGNLPDDFLRILPQQLDVVQNSQKAKIGTGPEPRGSADQERKLKQYLEDERVALFLQNEEFMKELQRNRDFLLALEKDRLKYESRKSNSTSAIESLPSDGVSLSSAVPAESGATGVAEASGVPLDEALFRDKLKHMGKSTRKKLFELARAFSEKTKMRKLKRKHSLKHHTLGTAPSTANLLDDVEGNSCDEDIQFRKQTVQEEDEENKEGVL
ncbi:CUE domain-containing protein 1b isoform X1 [Hypanus sabinus]|uniref:CUE domain-containing protein 1b isoform X1 n=1 Tax=Hypanus sabinus TaxID=79690 RepID=UPI0028C50FA5|nr:CUE domain-containing protein 1b isoform X1 [Hypanus sabinus]XP_059829378.1 CUE domain-containing protein 1b isoform X1 [Hypanus sabinus]XP_059829379.1 CUE domain-containing protein 1b isoform X1 [Hypanus sabinus]XP_059829380.1 CUE domain-containing protein 1b isoform X1 [Hypanus sabinus]XP_059829381.1 CUE domain-containing protein 1b isoform X1 [Hypanus sabinus]